MALSTRLDAEASYFRTETMLLSVHRSAFDSMASALTRDEPRDSPQRKSDRKTLWLLLSSIQETTGSDIVAILCIFALSKRTLLKLELKKHIPEIRQWWEQWSGNDGNFGCLTPTSLRLKELLGRLNEEFAPSLANRAIQEQGR